MAISQNCTLSLQHKKGITKEEEDVEGCVQYVRGGPEIFSVPGPENSGPRLYQMQGELGDGSYQEKIYGTDACSCAKPNGEDH
jgi:hypothetical protein